MCFKSLWADKKITIQHCGRVLNNDPYFIDLLLVCQYEYIIIIIGVSILLLVLSLLLLLLLLLLFICYFMLPKRQISGPFFAHRYDELGKLTARCSRFKNLANFLCYLKAYSLLSLTFVSSVEWMALILSSTGCRLFKMF